MMMNEQYLFLDYAWDLQPNYFHMKDADVAFNRPLISPEILDSLFLNHLQIGNIFIDSPISPNQLHIGLTKPGALVWEDYYNVQWSQFVNYDLESLEEEKIRLSIYATSKDNLLSIFPELEYQLSKNIEKIENWQATYWKNIKEGFKSYAVLSSEEELFNSCNEVELPRWRIESHEL